MVHAAGGDVATRLAHLQYLDPVPVGVVVGLQLRQVRRPAASRRLGSELGLALCYPAVVTDAGTTSAYLTVSMN
jgi:hypothetical protein